MSWVSKCPDCSSICRDVSSLNGIAQWLFQVIIWHFGIAQVKHTYNVYKFSTSVVNYDDNKWREKICNGWIRYTNYNNNNGRCAKSWPINLEPLTQSDFAPPPLFFRDWGGWLKYIMYSNIKKMATQLVILLTTNKSNSQLTDQESHY